MTDPHTMVNVRYMVDDVEDAVTFYTKVLDFEVLNNFARERSPCSTKRLLTEEPPFQ
jgi:catechol 2,3-dioxygenase-like lactoylglutathione lyase family enzyme